MIACGKLKIYYLITGILFNKLGKYFFDDSDFFPPLKWIILEKRVLAFQKPPRAPLRQQSLIIPIFPDSPKFCTSVYFFLAPFNVLYSPFTDDGEKENQYAGFTLLSEWLTQCHSTFDGFASITYYVTIESYKKLNHYDGDETIDLARRIGMEILCRIILLVYYAIKPEKP